MFDIPREDPPQFDYVSLAPASAVTRHVLCSHCSLGLSVIQSCWALLPRDVRTSAPGAHIIISAASWDVFLRSKRFNYFCQCSSLHVPSRPFTPLHVPSRSFTPLHAPSCAQLFVAWWPCPHFVARQKSPLVWGCLSISYEIEVCSTGCPGESVCSAFWCVQSVQYIQYRSVPQVALSLPQQRGR